AGPPGKNTVPNVDQWRLHQLGRFGDALPSDLRERRDSLAAEYGEPVDDTVDRIHAEWPGTHSPVDALAIATMTDDALIELLTTWQPTGGWAAPTIEGLRSQLQHAVKADPVRFGGAAMKFARVHPRYIEALFAGLLEAMAQIGPSSEHIGNGDEPEV